MEDFGSLIDQNSASSVPSTGDMGSMIDQYSADKVDVKAKEELAPKEKQSWSTLPANATNKMLASVADSILNTPTNIINLGKASFGTGATLAGHPELAPEITKEPNFATHLMQKYGLIKDLEMTHLQKFADQAVQSGTAMLLNPAQSVKQAASNVALGVLSGGTGNAVEQATGSQTAGTLAGMAAPLGVSAIANKVQPALAAAEVQKNQVAQNARNAGYVIPPSQTNPNAVNNVLEGISGKIQTGQHASLTNEAVTKHLAAAEVGLDSQDLTPANLAKIRHEAGQSYEAIKQQSPFVVDDKFKNDISRLGQENRDLATQFPDLANPKIDELLNNVVKNDQFDAGNTVTAIRAFRQKSTDLYQGINKSGGTVGDRETADTYKGIANSLENLIDRNLSATKPDLINQFRSARQVIAKTHAIEDSMNPATFEINPQYFAKELQKGTPLSGGLKEIGEFASAFPKAAQNLKGQSVLATSPLDYVSGLVGAGAGGAAGGTYGAIAGAGAAMARPAIRSLILSPAYQNTMGTKSMNSMTRDFIKKGDASSVAGMQAAFANRKENDQ